ncbi:MAG: response regulator [Chloroflexi bacterium]|nr:response regulator [Chloroflexota bacterium]
MEKLSVLVVEDNIDNYELVRFLLERAGHGALWARSGREGIDMAKANHPDLIIMDLSLPEMDGWTATERISIPEPLLSKPINISLFEETVAEILARKQGRQESTGGSHL